MNDITKLDIKEILSLYEKQELSPVELIDSYIARIESENSKLNAVVIRNFENARLQAQESSRRIKSGNARPLEGIPFINKPVFCAKDFVTNMCSSIIEDFKSPYNSYVIEQLENSGAIMLGSSNMDEFAMGSANKYSLYGPCFNPHIRSDGEKVIPGGSSGGGASSVATSFAPFALGTDTGGSVRQPAALCGIVGVKPTYGRCSRYGMIAFASSFDQAGILAKSVDSAALLLQTIAGYDNRDSTCADVPVPNYSTNSLQDKKFKIGIPKECLDFPLDEEIKERWIKLIGILKSLNHEIVEVSLPNLDVGIAVYYVLASAEASSNLLKYDGIRYGSTFAQNPKTLSDFYIDNRSFGFGNEVKRRILVGTMVLSSDYSDGYFKQALRVRNLICSDFQKVFSDVDCIFIPTSPTVAHPVEEQLSIIDSYMSDALTVPVNLAGLPAISIPAGLSKMNLPIGMQIISDSFEEHKMFAIAKILEEIVKNSLEFVN